MNKKQEIKDKMIINEGFCCISIDPSGKITSPVFGGSGPTHGVVTIYRDSVEELLQEIDVMSMHIKKRFGSPYGNQTCEWS
jgi:hypothetical protein